MNNTLLDNSEKFLMRDILQQFIGSGKYNHICIATGYWDLPGTALVYDQLKAFLESGGRLDILLGQEPQLRSYQTHAPESDQERFPDFYLNRDINLLTDEYRPTAELIQQYCNVHKYDNFVCNAQIQSEVDEIEEQEDSQIQIRVFGQEDPEHKQFLHAKCYIFLNPEEGEADGIIGSSNFTEKGLEDNAELNYLETNNQVVASDPNPYIKSKSHKTWFEEKWEQSVPWNGKFLQILSAAPVGQPKPEPEQSEQTAEDLTSPLTPYELYIKLLQLRFGNIVDKSLGEQIKEYLPSSYEAYDYQIDAVKQCFSTMKEHGGFMLADVVGLGKTIVGTLLIKHFLLCPDEEGHEQKVLIVTPPAIQSAWKRTIADFDEQSEVKIADFIDFITTGSIGKLTDDELEDEDEGHDTGGFDGELSNSNYGLILIDESHKFRNSSTSMYQALDSLIDTIGGETGVYPYIGLLSATPQNNRPADLQNQIYLFERNHIESTLKKANGGNIESFFAEVNRDFSSVMKPKDEFGNPMQLPIGVTNEKLKEISLKIRDCVLSDIMVRRTRTDVQKYYQNDKSKQQMHFPLIQGPISLEYKMSSSLACLFNDSMMSIAPMEANGEEGLRYYRYRAIQYLKKAEDKQKYKGRGALDADKLSEQLAHIMQIGLVKRLESSFTAFKQSLLNLRQYTQNMIQMWEDDCIFVCPQINVNAELDRKAKEKRRNHKVTIANCYDDVRAKIEKLTAEGRNKDNSNKEYHRSDFDEQYIEYLRYDLEIIDDLCARWSMNSEDPKFDVFKEELKPTLFAKDTNHSQKLVVFTEAIDTASSIASAAEAKGFKVLLINADNRDDNEQVIRENFDANYKGEWKDDYEVIVTTDVLAEGINLHRANCILNYDTPWNSTRLMQRIGRVNRIGSTCDNVYVYNFMPSAEGDAEINLVQKAHNKLQSFHTLFGEDSQVFTTTEEVTHYDLNTEVNGEESPLEKYVFELKQYKEKHPMRYAFIEHLSDRLELATISSNGTAYFMVRAPRVSGMFVEVTQSENEGRILSLSDGIEAFHAAEETPATELPENWEKWCDEAKRVVVAELAFARSNRSNSKKATAAKGAIIEIKEQFKMSAESKKLLNTADKLIRKGNYGMVNRILNIAKELEDRNNLFPLTQEDIDECLKDELAMFVASAKTVHGEPEIVLGTYK